MIGRLHFRLQYDSDNFIRIRKLNDDDVAQMPDDLPDDQPPPAPVSDADVRFTIYDDLNSPIAGYDNLQLDPYGDPSFANYKRLLEDVQLQPGHYEAKVVATKLDGRIVRRSALVSVSDD